jgi:hypothetical protein
MFLSADRIKKNITWLLSNGSSPVKYLTHKYLLATPADSKLMKDLWREVGNSREAKDIFKKQEKNGSWCADGSWALPAQYLPKDGYTPVSPKYVTTAWILPILGDMGFTNKDKRINKACEYLLAFQYKNGFIGENPIKKYDAFPDRIQNPCRFAVTMIGFGKVGMGKDPRVIKAYNLFLKWQREDGGWVFEEHYKKRNWTRSCPWSTYHTTMALYSSGNDSYKQAINKALKFLVWHLSTKEESKIRRFFYHGHSTVHELLMLSEFNIGLKQKPVQTILEWLMTMYHPDECYFRYAGKPISKYSRHKDAMDARVAKYRLYHLIEDDWLTYYLTRIGMNLIKHEFNSSS